MAVLETLGAKQLGEILVMKYSIKDTTNWLTEHANNHVAMLATKNSTRLSTLLAMDDWYFLGRVSSFNVVLCVRVNQDLGAFLANGIISQIQFFQ